MINTLQFSIDSAIFAHLRLTHRRERATLVAIGRIVDYTFALLSSIRRVAR